MPPTDPDGDPLVVTITGLPTHGSVRFGAAQVKIGDRLRPQDLPALIYLPDPGSEGDVGALRYLVDDGHGGKVEGRVQVDVAPLADATGLVSEDRLWQRVRVKATSPMCNLSCGSSRNRHTPARRASASGICRGRADGCGCRAARARARARRPAPAATPPSPPPTPVKPAGLRCDPSPPRRPPRHFPRSRPPAPPPAAPLADAGARRRRRRGRGSTAAVSGTQNDKAHLHGLR